MKPELMNTRSSHQPVIRLAQPADVDALVELGATTFRETYSPTDDAAEIEDYVATAFTPAIFRAILKDPASTLMVLTADQRLIGYAQLKRSAAPGCVTGPTPIELSRLYLRQETIGKGHGTALMNAVLAEARRQQCATMWLGVYDRNERARTFYRRWGFVDVGTKNFMFGGRAYADPVMVATIPRSRGT